MAKGPHRYDIILTQGDLRIELTSDDVYFIAKQMNKWFDILINDAYVAVTLPVRRKAVPSRSTTSAPAKLSPRVAEEVLPPIESLPIEPPPVEIAAVAPAAEPVALSPLPDEIPVDLPRLQESKTIIEEVVVPPVLSAQPPSPAEGQPVLSERVKDDFEAVMDTILEDLNQEEEVPEVHAAVGFSVPKPTLQPEVAMVDSLPELYEKSRAKTPEAFLMLSAYYLTYIDGEERFSLKRLNALMIRSGYSPLTHSVLENVLTQGYLAMVPDLTGTADVTEYSLTPSGQAYANQLL